MALETMAGPAWSLPGLEQTQGRFPLGVEAHVLRTVDMLVPGVTSATRLARYYALHGLVWAEAKERELSLEDALEFMRRCEVVLGAVSLTHAHEWAMSDPHGADAIHRHVERTGRVEIDNLAKRGGYVTTNWGFAGTYFGAERVLGILGPSASGEPPPPGPRCDVQTLREELGEILELSTRSVLELDELEALGHLCACRAVSGKDGAWLRGVFLNSSSDEDLKHPDESRKATARLLARAIDTKGEGPPNVTFREVLAYGDFVDVDPIAQGLTEARIWQGVLLRNHSVSAWRRIWSWLVEQIGPDGTTRRELAASFTAQLPDQSVADFVGQLPPTSQDGVLLSPEEELLTNGRDVLACLQVLALGVRRLGELDGDALKAFSKDDDRALGPVWFAEQLSAAAERPLHLFATDIVDRLFDRAERIALQRTLLRDGVVHNPARIREREGLLFRLSNEGWGDIGTRVWSLGQVLAGAGVFAVENGRWRVTEIGRSLVS